MRILAAGPGRSRADEGAPRFFAARRNGHPITLKELGVTAVGHHLKLLDAIAALRIDTSAKPTSAGDHLRTPERIYRRPRRAPAGDGDVFGPCRFDSTLWAYGP